MTELLEASALAALSSAILVWLLAKGWFGRLALDSPNERSLHDRPVPRIGGLGLFAAAALIWAILGGGALQGIVILAGVLLLPCLIDDIFNLPALVRFAAQIAVALLFLAISGAPVILWPLLLLVIVWMANLFNFMDGSDGLAGGMAVFGFAGYTFVAALAGAHDIALVAGIIGGAAAGFLIWNFNPAIVFLGDAGSVPLGFLAATVGIAGWQRDVWPPTVPFLLFAPFIIDATITLFRRLLSRENIVKAHRTHLYQRLIGSGLSHRCVALGAYALMFMLVLLALFSRTLGVSAHLILVAALYAFLATGFLLIGRNLPATERKSV